MALTVDSDSTEFFGKAGSRSVSLCIGEIDADQLNAFGRMAGPVYVRTKDRFEMIRPA